MAVDRYGRKISSAEAKRRAGYRSDLQFRSADAISGGRAGELKKRAAYRKAAGTKAATTKTRSVAAKGTRNVSGKAKTGTVTPKPVTNPRGTPGAVSGQAKSNWNKRQQTAARRRQTTVKAVGAVVTGDPIGYAARTGIRYATGQVARRLPKVNRTQVWRSVSQGATSAYSSAEKWWKGY